MKLKINSRFHSDYETQWRKNYKKMWLNRLDSWYNFVPWCYLERKCVSRAKFLLNVQIIADLNFSFCNAIFSSLPFILDKMDLEIAA